MCVIEGRWADGGEFRYQAWDVCSKMKVKRGTQNQYADFRPHGSDKRFKGGDIPINSEVIEIGNDFSAIVIFKDRLGMEREIMFRD